MHRTIRAALLGLTLAGGLALADAAPVSADITIDFDFFEGRLSPYGRWMRHPHFGQVWRPVVVDRSWRPYTRGHWVYTLDYGWLWQAEESWGWATHHYGRWYHEPRLGWFWIPGYQWAPAWVEWRGCDDYYGWAPLPPRGYRLDARHWVFVPPRSFLAPSIHRYAIAPSRNVTILSRAPIVGRVSERNGRWHNDGIDVARVERATRTRVEPQRVREVQEALRDEGARDDGRVLRPRPAGRTQPRSAAAVRAAPSEPSVAPAQEPTQRKQRGAPTARRRAEPEEALEIPRAATPRDRTPGQENPRKATTRREGERSRVPDATAERKDRARSGNPRAQQQARPSLRTPSVEPSAANPSRASVRAREPRSSETRRRASQQQLEGAEATTLQPGALPDARAR